MKVKSITPAGRADVYNMEVEDTHSFVIQGGVISHNCADAIRYGKAGLSPKESFQNWPFS